MNPEFDVRQAIAQKRAVFEAALADFFPHANDDTARIVAAMRYSLEAGGKRLRPVLALFTADALRLDYRAVLPAAVAIEMIHTYSLIHDDLPAMDNDDLRRGKPTNHKMFGEAAAILAGDGLLTLAFEVLAERTPDKATVAPLALEIARAAGFGGMVGGQMLDILAESAEIDLERLRAIHRMKTGALIRTAVTVAGIAARTDDAVMSALGVFGERIGLVFQIVDDILDVTAETEALGKTAGKDVKAGKATYPALLGLTQAREHAAAVNRTATTDLLGAIPNAGNLAALAGYMLDRIN